MIRERERLDLVEKEMRDETRGSEAFERGERSGGRRRRVNERDCGSGCGRKDARIGGESSHGWWRWFW
jgi:hypothetical protein